MTSRDKNEYFITNNDISIKCVLLVLVYLLEKINTKHF